MTVYKYPFCIADRVELTLPVGSCILHVEHQNGQPADMACLWALVEPGAAPARACFRLYGTGHPINAEDVLGHVATWQHGSFVWHLFRSAL